MPLTKPTKRGGKPTGLPFVRRALVNRGAPPPRTPLARSGLNRGASPQTPLVRCGLNRAPSSPPTASDVHSFADDSNLHKSSSFQCQPSSNARSQSRLVMSSTINSDLQSISEWGTRNLVKFNTSKTQLLTISLSNTPSNYPIIFGDSEIPPLNSINILGLQISSSLSWRDHIVQIAK